MNYRHGRKYEDKVVRAINEIDMAIAIGVRRCDRQGTTKSGRRPHRLHAHGFEDATSAIEGDGKHDPG
jgi:hypothetical protein